MWRSVIQDSAKFASVVTVVDDSLLPNAPAIGSGNVEEVPFSDVEHRSRNVWAVWSDLANSHRCDKILVIAPEVLEEFLPTDQQPQTFADGVKLLRGNGHNVVAADDRVLRLAADKWQSAELLIQSGVPHPATYDHEASRQVSHGHTDHPSGWIVKPRWGFGSQSVRRHHSLAAAGHDCGTRDVIQQFVDGEPVSISAVVGKGRVQFLPAMRQHIDPEDFGYSGSSGPLDSELDQRCRKMASQAIDALSISNAGYVGFDIVLAARPAGDRLIEINARLTSSYVELRRIVPFNIAEWIFGIET